MILYRSLWHFRTKSCCCARFAGCNQLFTLLSVMTETFTGLPTESTVGVRRSTLLVSTLYPLDLSAFQSSSNLSTKVSASSFHSCYLFLQIFVCPLLFVVQRLGAWISYDNMCASMRGVLCEHAWKVSSTCWGRTQWTSEAVTNTTSELHTRLG